jgi:hypothetical protein
VHVNRSLLGWGVFFIVLGAVPLAVRSGVVDESMVGRAWQLWPLLLIGAGIGLVLSRTRVAVVGGLVVAATAGLMLGGLLASGINGFAGFPSFGDGFTSCIARSDAQPFPDQRGTLTSPATVDIELDCGELDIRSVAGDRWTVSGTGTGGTTPEIDAADARLSIRTAQTRGLERAGGTWTVELPQGPETALDLAVNAGSARATLDDMTLRSVDLRVNAGSATIDLSGTAGVDRIDGEVNAGSLAVTLPARDVTGSLSANAGSLHVCVPPRVDLRIVLEDNALGGNNFGDAGLVQDGNTWTSAGFGSASATIVLTARANLGSIELNPEAGCDE